MVLLDPGGALSPVLGGSASPPVGPFQVPRKSPGPGRAAGLGPKTRGRQPARAGVTHHPKPMGGLDAQEQCPTPTAATLLKTAGLGLF